MTDEQLLTRTVFVDTSIYEAANYHFNDHKLAALRKFVDEDIVYLVTTEVTCSEIQAHLNNKVHELLAAHKTIRKDLKLLRNTPQLPHHRIFEPLTEAMVLTPLLDAYQTFFDSKKIQCLPTKDVQLDDIMARYFKELPPFDGTKKKHEFPDAIALLGLEAYADQIKNDIYVLSTDTDMLRFCEHSDRLIGLKHLSEFLNLVNRNEETLQEPSDAAELAFQNLKDDILDRAKSCFEEAEFSSSISVTHDDEVEVIQVLDVSIQSPEQIEVSREEAVYTCYLNVRFLARHSWVSYETSGWDSEDKVYVYLDQQRATMQYEEEYPFTVVLSYDDGLVAHTRIEDFSFDLGSSIELEMENGLLIEDAGGITD